MKNQSTSPSKECQDQPIAQAPKPHLTVVNGRVTTTSLDIAETFEKRHDNVIRDIRNLECSTAFRALNFEETQQVVDAGATRRKIPVFNITRDGWTILVMGFTGEKAMAWKEKYIAAFNLMERRLLEQTMKALKALPQSETLTPSQQREVQNAVTELAYSMSKGEKPGRDVFAAIYRKIKDGFQVGTYKQVPSARFDELMAFIGGTQKALPEPEPIKIPILKPDTTHMSDADRAVIYDHFMKIFWDLENYCEDINNRIGAMKASLALIFPDLCIKSKANYNIGKSALVAGKD